MSRTETLGPPPQADTGFNPSFLRSSPSSQEKTFDPYMAPFEIPFRRTEVGLLLGSMANEGAITGMQLEKFNKMPISSDTEMRRIFFGEGLSRDYPKKVVVANGFSPPPEYLIEALEDYIQEPYSAFLQDPFSQTLFQSIHNIRNLNLSAMQAMIGIKSNDFLVPFNRWVERLGHDVMFGYDEPNELQTETFFNLVETLEFQAGNREVTGIGLSAGGMFMELAADHLLQKHGRPIVNTVIKGGSPEITQDTISEFSSAARRPNGVMGLVHGIAQRRMSEDPMRSEKYDGFSVLEEMMIDYALRGPDPRIEIVTFYTEGDSTVPQPQNPNQATEVGGTHMGILYQPKLLDKVGRILARPYQDQRFNLAA